MKSIKKTTAKGRQRQAARKAWRTIRSNAEYVRRASAALDAWELRRDEEADN